MKAEEAAKTPEEKAAEAKAKEAAEKAECVFEEMRAYPIFYLFP